MVDRKKRVWHTREGRDGAPLSFGKLAHVAALGRPLGCSVRLLTRHELCLPKDFPSKRTLVFYSLRKCRVPDTHATLDRAKDCAKRWVKNDSIVCPSARFPHCFRYRFVRPSQRRRNRQTPRVVSSMFLSSSWHVATMKVTCGRDRAADRPAEQFEDRGSRSLTSLEGDSTCMERRRRRRRRRRGELCWERNPVG
jgi:hypothetical protein